MQMLVGHHGNWHFLREMGFFKGSEQDNRCSYLVFNRAVLAVVLKQTMEGEKWMTS